MGVPSVRWWKPWMAVDAVIFTTTGRVLQVLTHRRAAEPDAGKLALPGVFLNENEAPDDAARRALKSKTNLDFSGEVHLVSVENHPQRKDPRGWVITTVFVNVVPWWELYTATAEAPGVQLLNVYVPWRDYLGEPVAVDTPAQEPVELAFDHNYLIGKAVAWLRREAWRTDLLLRLVRPEFTLRELQDVYEAVLGEPLHRTTFRRRMVDVLKLIEPTGNYREDQPRRPEVYRRRC